MKLIGTKTSPFVRKVRVLLAEKRLSYEFVEDNVWSADTKVPNFNPLNKVPALQLDAGESIYDSAVIAEYLDGISGGEYLPKPPAERARVKCQEALGDGIADAGITVFLERKRDAARQDAAWMGRQLDKMNAAIASLSGTLGSQPYLGGAQMNLGDIACACGLFWAEFRMPELRWRDQYSNLKAWAERMEARASFASTQPPG